MAGVIYMMGSEAELSRGCHNGCHNDIPLGSSTSCTIQRDYHPSHHPHTGTLRSKHIKLHEKITIAYIRSDKIEHLGFDSAAFH